MDRYRKTDGLSAASVGARVESVGSIQFFHDANFRPADRIGNRILCGLVFC